MVLPADTLVKCLFTWRDMPTAERSEPKKKICVAG